MNCEDRKDDLVELGVASEETKGGSFAFVDTDRTLQPHYGLSDD
ncbi:MAG: benenodin family lasso peptide [Bacillota bacterium]